MNIIIECNFGVPRNLCDIWIFLPRDTMIARYILCLCERLSVRLSITRRYCIETTRRIELVFDIRVSPTYHKVCCKEILAPPKIRVLPSRTLPQTLDLEKCRHSTPSRWCGQQISSTVELVDCPATVERTAAGCTKFITHWSAVTL